jgi:hypothetical protein
MDYKKYMWAAVGVAMIYAAKKVSAIPDIARAPLTVLGTIMAIEPIDFFRDKTI